MALASGPSFYDEVWAARETEANEVGDGIYLGSVHASASEKILQSWKITHILVVHPGLSMLWPDRYTYQRVPLEDAPICNLLELLPEALDFLWRAQLGGRVLVHCTRGISRSTSIVIAFLMLAKGLSYEDARLQVESKRPVAYPNLGFQVQLQHLESLMASRGTANGEFAEKVSWLRSVVPRGDLTAQGAAFRVQAAMSQPVREQLDEVCALSEKMLSDPELAKDRAPWKPYGVFFEVLQKYKTVPEDAALLDLASTGAKRLHESISQFHDSSDSLRGLKSAAALAAEIETWIRVARAEFTHGRGPAKPLTFAETPLPAGPLVSYGSDSSSEDEASSAKKQRCA